jgi:hypothetical protein
LEESEKKKRLKPPRKKMRRIGDLSEERRLIRRTATYREEHGLKNPSRIFFSKKDKRDPN